MMTGNGIQDVETPELRRPLNIDRERRQTTAVCMVDALTRSSAGRTRARSRSPIRLRVRNPHRHSIDESGDALSELWIDNDCDDILISMRHVSQILGILRSVLRH